MINRMMDEGRDLEVPESDCDWALIGVGRKCGGRTTRHWLQSLQARVEAQAAWDLVAS